jgi:origin recognition complex subunit 5
MVGRVIAPILNGESLKHIGLLLTSRLSRVSRFLLIAAYLCSHNPVKFDLRLFGSIIRRSRIYNASGAAKGKMTATAVKYLRAAPRSFLLDRLLAVFFFIFPSDDRVPTLMDVFRELGALVNRGLVCRVTSRNRLDMVKFKCPLPVDLIGMVAKSSCFDLFRYLVNTTG